MTEYLGDCLLRQLDIAWKLARYHLDGLTTDDCLWRPAERGLHVYCEGGRWTLDWPPKEEYGAGPPNIAWIGWHMLFWWSMALDWNFGSTTLNREDVAWPGDADVLRRELETLYDKWRGELEALDDEALQAPRARWPVAGRTLGDLFAWANIELTKNAAEIGYARFLRGGLDQA
jgi:hypothetical protein